MKKIFLLAATIFCFLNLTNAQQPGQLDSSFGINGVVKTNLGKNYNYGNDSIHAGNTIYKSTAIQKDGKIVAVGRTWNGSNFDFAIARYNADGSLDNTFSSDGAQTTDFTSKEDEATSVAIQNDGKIVVVGHTGADIHPGTYNDSSDIISIARYNTDGRLDNTFSNDGKLQTDFSGKGSNAYSVAIQSDGKIVVFRLCRCSSPANSCHAHSELENPI